MATGNIGRAGRRREPAARPEQRAGLLRHGLASRTSCRATATSPTTPRARMFEKLWGVTLDPEPGLRIPNMLDAAVDGTFKGIYIQGEDILQSDPNTKHVTAGARGDGMRRRAGPVPERDGELRPCLPAGLDLPREGRHLHQRRAPHQPRAQGDGAEERHGRLGDHARHRQGDGLRDALQPSVRDHGRDRPADADLRRRLLRPARQGRLGPVAVQREGAARHAGHAYRRLRARQGQVHDHRVRADRREGRPALPAAADHRPHPQPVQCRRADAAHRQRRLARARTCSRSIRTTPSSAACATATG